MAINKRDRNRGKQFKIASIFILAILILCTLLTGLYKYNTDQLVLHYENEMFVRRDTEWNTIELYINELYNSLESKLSSVAQKVESNIIFSYKDNMSELQKQLEDGNYIHLCNTIREDIKHVYLTDVKNDKGARKYVTTYQLTDKSTGAVLAETSETKAKAKEIAKSLYTDKGFKGEIVCTYTKQVAEGEAVAFTASYAPS